MPLYLTTRLGLSGAWVDLHVPGSEQAGVELKPDCALVLFELQGRQVAGWVVRNGAVCPEPRYPGKDALATGCGPERGLGKPVPGRSLKFLPLSANLTHAWRGADAGRLHVA